MLSQTYRILLGASLALCIGAAGAQNAPDNSRMSAQKGTNATTAQPSEQPTAPQSNADATHAAAVHHARKSASRQHEAVSPEEKSYREALRQCAEERNESQRDTCLDTAIGQHEPNS